MGEHLAGMLHEHAQQVVLLGRKLHLLVGDLDDAAHEVDRRSPAAEDRPLAMHLKLMTKRRPHARKQFIHAERLGDVIVGAEVERLDLADLVAAARQHHDRDALVARADHPQQFEALHIGQSKIENDQIGILRQQLERGLAVRRLQDFVALRAQAHAQQLADGRLVIDHQNLERGRAHAAVSSCLVAGGIGSLIVKTAPVPVGDGLPP